MKTLFENKIEHGIDLLRMYQPHDKPYYGCFSGGKDSCVIKEIARMGNIGVVWHYNITTIDPPELVRFIKHQHPDVILEKPNMPFFEKAKTRGFPTRLHRWCCEEYKERRVPREETLIMGIRSEESQSRSKRWKEVSAHVITGQWVIAPILHWNQSEVWGFIKETNIAYCNLYNEGFTRLGCVGCPFAQKQRIIQFNRWPHFERSWRRLFCFLWNKKPRDGFASHQEWFDWWINGRGYPKNDECQGILDMYV